MFDLFNLFQNVRQKGGYEAVSRNGLWDLVAKESGLGSVEAVIVKLLYIKYLDALEGWLSKVVENKFPKCTLNASGNESCRNSPTSCSSSESCGNSSTNCSCDEPCGNSKALQTEFKELLLEVTDSKKEDEICESHSLDVEKVKGMIGEPDTDNSRIRSGAILDLDSKKRGVNVNNTEDFGQDKEPGKLTVSNGVMNSVAFHEHCGLNFAKSDSDLTADEIKSKTSCSDGIKKHIFNVEGDNDNDNDRDVTILDSVSGNEEDVSRKRKRDSMLEMRNWVTGIAKNPCNPVIGLLPERSKWSSYGNDVIWKQVLTVRTLFQNRKVDPGDEQSPWQRYQKMHPCMYGDHQGTGYSLRERSKCDKRLLSENLTSQACPGSSSTGTVGDLDRSPSHLSDMEYVPNYITLGPGFQAELPECKGVGSESDSKWFGTQVWPLRRKNHKNLIETDRIGKGRQDSCGCEVPSSVECVRFHIVENRYKIKLELGSAFHLWKFDKMGEQVARFWTEKEEIKFKDIVRLNPASLSKCFWDVLFKTFQNKRREDRVSYYFNVFILRRRRYQNRFTSDNIDSDDDESELEFLRNGNGHKAHK